MREPTTDSVTPPFRLQILLYQIPRHFQAVSYTVIVAGLVNNLQKEICRILKRELTSCIIEKNSLTDRIRVDGDRNLDYGVRDGRGPADNEE